MPDHATYPLRLPRADKAAALPRLAAAALALTALLVAASAGLRAHGISRPSTDSRPTAEVSSVVSEPDESAAHVEDASSTTAPAEAPPAAIGAASAPSRQAAATAQTSAASSQAAPAPLAPQPAAAAGARWEAGGFVFVAEGQEWDEASYRNVDAALAALPARIRAQLGNRSLGPVNILVNRSGRSLSGKQPYNGPANYFSTNDGRNELVLFPGQSVQTILHELGHAYNLRRIAAGRYALVLLDEEMRSFMAAAGWRILSTPEQISAARDHMQVQFAYEGAQVWSRVSNHDPLEDFANSFALYFLAPSDLASRSPERFAWFEANVGR
ncbi:MAG TPA: hypothetical protein VNN10_00845 [Dehalococcoidia bacterium]|nr:hypothetical protein [Dehalococcoidia bacterium]